VKSNGWRLRVELTGGLQSSEGERGEVYRFGKERGWAAGRKLDWAGSFPPGLLIYFFLLSSFLFLISDLFPHLLQKGFKSTQTTFRNFLKFKVSKWDSKKQVFKII
jgi:hypothetical protein